MDTVRILRYDEDDINAYARVEWTNVEEGTVCVSNMNMPYQGTFAHEVMKLSDVEFIKMTAERPDPIVSEKVYDVNSGIHPVGNK